MNLRQKKPISSIILYVAASIIAILGVALLINNILLYRTNVAQYVAQGTAVGIVTAQMIPAQLIPGILEPISVFCGIALLLLGTGVINEKVSKIKLALTENEICDIFLEKSALKEDLSYVKTKKPDEEPARKTETIS